MMLRVLIFVSLMAALGGGLWWVQRTPPPDLVVRDVVAHPVQGAPQSVMVTFTVENTGGPDLLVDVAAPDTRLAMLKTMKTRGLPIPADAAPSLSMEAGHVMLMGLDTPARKGERLPLTLIFDRAGDIGIEATVGEAAMDDTPIIEGGPEAPGVVITASPNGDGWHLSLDLERFTMSEAAVGTPHEQGVGHARLYVDGIRIGQIYRPEVILGALPPGSHTVEIALFSNDRRAYVIDGVPIRAVVEVGAD